METLLTFDDVLIAPRFSTISSRKDVALHRDLGNEILRLPVLSSNMDTITDHRMAQAMHQAGGLGILHRFWSIEENIKEFRKFPASGVSIGLGGNELQRAEALFDHGAFIFVIDVAHGASMDVVKQTAALSNIVRDNACIIVGNFANSGSIQEFEYHMPKVVEFFKIGIGPGSACTTRIKTGVGVPQLSAIQDCSRMFKTIADGGMRTPGDVAKALSAGAQFVMLGGMLAGCDETPGETVYLGSRDICKKYRGSASKESYEAQGKDDSWRTAEGESFLVPVKGPVKDVLADIEGGLRSACSYVGASNLDEFRDRSTFVRVSPSTVIENSAHGRRS